MLIAMQMSHRGGRDGAFCDKPSPIWPQRQSLFPVKQTKSPDEPLPSISSHFQKSLARVNILILHQPLLFQNMMICYSHVLVHFVKSIGAYNVKSSSTLFSDNVQWSFEISFPCARFKSLVGYNLITKSSNHQKWDVQALISWNWKNTLSCEIYFF